MKTVKIKFFDENSNIFKTAKIIFLKICTICNILK